MSPATRSAARGGLGCAWVVLLIGGPCAVLAAMVVFVQVGGAGGRVVALALLALALMAALGSVWVRRLGLVRASTVPADPVERMRETFGPRALEDSVAAPEPLGGSLAPAFVNAPTGAALASRGGITAGDGRVPRGLTVGWSQNGAELPRLDLYSAGFDAAIAHAITGELVRVDHPDLIDPWLMGAAQAEAFTRALGDPLIAMLNTHTERSLAIIFDGWGVAAVMDEAGDMGVTEAIGIAAMMRSALPDSLYRRKDGTAGRDAILSGVSARAYRRTAELGVLASEGRVKAQWQGVIMAGVFLAVFAAGAVVALAAGQGDRATSGTVVTLLAALLVGATLTTVAIAAVNRLSTRQRNVAREVRRAAGELGARYRSRVRAAEEGWSRRPFGAVERIVASPVALGTIDERPLGVAFISGDAGVGRLRARTFTSRVVWVEVEAPLPPVTLVREDMTQRMLAILGGDDLDVESAAFNDAWRVRAANPRFAHAMLQPTLIEMLLTVTEPGIAFHIDGTRVAVWDDATVGEADLVERAHLVSQFASKIPDFVAQDWKVSEASAAGEGSGDHGVGPA